MRIYQFQNLPKQTTTTQGAKKGLNLRDFPTLLEPSFAQTIQNYQVLADGIIAKRKGFTVADTFTDTPLTLYKKLDQYFTFYAYGTSLGVIDKRDGSKTIIKSDFDGTDFEGIAYGDYFFCGTSVNQLHRVEYRINYSNETDIGNVAAGDLILNSSNQVVGVVAEINTSSDYIVVTRWSAVKIVASETLHTTSVGGDATFTADSAGWEAITVTNAPSVGSINVFGNRMFIGSRTSLYYSEVDDNQSTPFTSFAVGTLVGEGGEVTYKPAGYVNAIASLGDVYVVLQDDGVFAFTIQQVERNSVVEKYDQIRMSRLTRGGCRAYAETDSGLVYLNNSSLNIIRSIGQDNVAYDDQEYVSSSLLGKDYFKNADLTNADMFYDYNTRTLFITYAEGSNVNNTLLVYNMEYKAFSTISGWNVNRFHTEDAEIYAISSTSGELHKLFQNYDDNGQPIGTVYEQELNVGDLATLKELLATHVQAIMSLDSIVEISFDIYDEYGKKHEDILKFTLNAGDIDLSTAGYSESPYNSAWGGAVSFEDLIETRADSKERIGRFQRIILRIMSSDASFHAINWLRISHRDKAISHKRKLIRNYDN